MFSTGFSPSQRNQQLKKIFDDIKKGSAFKWITCVGLDITVEEFKELSEILKDKKFLFLDLNTNGTIGIEYMETLQQIILGHPELKKIKLDANNMTDEAILKLVSNLQVRDRLPNIEITFSINPYSEVGFIAAAECMSTYTVLGMDCSPLIRNRVEVDAICNKLETLLKNTEKNRTELLINKLNHIKNVSESKCIECKNLGITEDEFKELAEILKTKKYQILDLSQNNTINEEYMETLQKIILNNPHLKEIKLDSNEIGNDAIIKLVSNPKIQERLPYITLSLTDNPYSDAGFFAATQHMSPSTIVGMNCKPYFFNKAAIDEHCDKLIEAIEAQKKEKAAKLSTLYKYTKEERKTNFDEKEQPTTSSTSTPFNSNQPPKH